MPESMLAPSMPERKPLVKKERSERRQASDRLKPLDPVDPFDTPERIKGFEAAVETIQPKSFRKKKKDAPLTPAGTYDEFEKWSEELRKELEEAPMTVDEEDIITEVIPNKETPKKRSPLESLRKMGFESRTEKIERKQKELNTRSEKVVIDDKVATLRKQIEKPQTSTEGVTKMLNEQISELNRREGILEEKRNMALSSMGTWSRFKNFLSGLTGGTAVSPEKAELENLETQLENIRARQNALREELQLISYGENKDGRSKAENTVEVWANEGRKLNVKRPDGSWAKGMVMEVGRDGNVEISIEGDKNAKFYTANVSARELVDWQKEEPIDTSSFVKTKKQAAKDMLRDAVAIAPGIKTSMERDQDLVEANRGIALDPKEFTDPKKFDEELEKGIEEPLDTSFVKTKRRAAKDMLRDAAAIVPGTKTSMERDRELADNKIGVALSEDQFTDLEEFEGSLNDENREARKRAGEGMSTEQASEVLSKSVAHDLWDKVNKSFETKPEARGFIAMKNAAINEYPATMYVYEVAKALEAKRNKDKEMFNLAVSHIREWNDMLGLKDDVVESIITEAPEKKTKKNGKK